MLTVPEETCSFETPANPPPMKDGYSYRPLSKNRLTAFVRSLDFKKTGTDCVRAFYNLRRRRPTGLARSFLQSRKTNDRPSS